MIREMDKELNSGQMAMSIMDLGKTMVEMELELLNGKMEIVMKVLG